MIKQEVIVPRGIRFLSDWYDFIIPNHPCILDKGLTGCGFTQYCITNNENVILCSPRKMLLENKEQQNPNEVLYVRNEYDKSLEVDKDLNAKPSRFKENIDIVDPNLVNSHHGKLKAEILNYVLKCKLDNKPCKILVTYDSFHIVKEALGESIHSFRVVIDEFQSIFTDSRFKSDTEMGFLGYLIDIQRLCFVSATPMMDSYLDQLDEFKDLPYYTLNWAREDVNRIIKPQLDIKSAGKSINLSAKTIIKSYLEGDFEKTVIVDEDGELKEIVSREAVFYVNSVKNITDMIRQSGLTADQVNILCANTPHNLSKIQTSLKSRKFTIGRVPLPTEINKMFTFCTRTVYLGADFYSTNARTFIFSDANIDCLAVDITLDLPQILGRQRLEINPWKTRATLYVKFLKKDRSISKEIFDAWVGKKFKTTENLLNSIDSLKDELKQDVAFKYKKDPSNYRDDYVAVNKLKNGQWEPVLNKLVMLSEQRAFEIQQIDYADRFSMFARINQTNEVTQSSSLSLEFLDKFNQMSQFPDRMKLVCSENYKECLSVVLKQIPIEYSKYYNSLGPEKIKACSFAKSYLEDAYKKAMFNGQNELMEMIYEEFRVGDRFTLNYIANKITNMYKVLDYPYLGKATVLLEYFDCTKTKVTVRLDNGTKKVVDGYKLIKKLR